MERETKIRGLQAQLYKILGNSVPYFILDNFSDKQLDRVARLCECAEGRTSKFAFYFLEVEEAVTAIKEMLKYQEERKQKYISPSAQAHLQMKGIIGKQEINNVF